MKYFSMFSGIGGFELGIQRGSTKNLATKEQPRCETEKNEEIGNKEGQREQHNNINSTGFTCVGYSEIDKYSIQTYKKNFGEEVRNYGDATKINPEELPDFDMLCGGFPCQAFSIAGKRAGFEDTRGTLFFDIARILKVKRPKIVLLENVKGLLNHNKGETFSVILQTLDELGYETQWMVLNSKFFGVPQNRERVFIIGSLRGTSRPEILPLKFSSQGNLKYCGGAISTREKWLKDGKNNSRNFSQGQRIYSKEGISQTLAGNAGGQGGKTGLYDIGGLNIRRLTPTECERLQGFPDGWTEGVSDTQRYKQLGNAVTVNVIQAIAERLV